MKRKLSNDKKIRVLFQVVLVVLAFLGGLVFTAIFYKMAESDLDLRPTQVTGGWEIERKWLLDPENIPIDLENEAVGIWEIKQTYLNFSPEIRVRDITERNGERYFILTVKSDMSVDGLIRNEKEWYITEEEYNHLLSKSEGNTIFKTRYRIDRDDLHYEFDIFHNQLTGLAYLEIEFTDEQVARDFPDPDFAIKDVTSDKRFKNQSLARYGKPQD